MDVQLISVPYHLGRRGGAGMALGPERILAAIPDAPTHHRLDPGRAFSNEIASTFDIGAALARDASRAARDGFLPIVLSANCIAAVGSVAALDGPRTGIVWLDAHGDFNTAGTTPTGYLDGTALAAATGGEWRTLTSAIPDFRPVDPANVIHVGGRDFDDGERETMAAAGIDLVATSDFDRLASAFDRLATRVDAVYLHVDVDVLDVSVGRANGYACPGGLSRDLLLEAVTLAIRRLRVRAVGFAAYDPSFDPEGRIAEIAAEAVGGIRATRTA